MKRPTSPHAPAPLTKRQRQRSLFFNAVLQFRRSVMPSSRRKWRALAIERAAPLSDAEVRAAISIVKHREDLTLLSDRLRGMNA